MKATWWIKTMLECLMAGIVTGVGAVVVSSIVWIWIAIFTGEVALWGVAVVGVVIAIGVTAYALADCYEQAADESSQCTTAVRAGPSQAKALRG